MDCSLLLPLILSCLVLVPITAASGAPVLDTDGHPVLRGGQYYILAPQVRGLGNLGLAPSASRPCPLSVYLKPYPYGPAAMFYPERSQGNGSSVLVGEDLSVLFAAPTQCSSDSTQWTLNRKTGIVTTGGSLSSPPAKISYSRFRIARYEFPNRNFYQFLSCPGKGAAACSTLGVTTDQLLRRTSEVLVVSFMKVPEGSV